MADLTYLSFILQMHPHSCLRCERGMTLADVTGIGLCTRTERIHGRLVDAPVLYLTLRCHHCGCLQRHDEPALDRGMPELVLHVYAELVSRAHRELGHHRPSKVASGLRDDHEWRRFSQRLESIRQARKEKS